MKAAFPGLAGLRQFAPPGQTNKSAFCMERFGLETVYFAKKHRIARCAQHGAGRG
jgi:hypothetical protein